MKRAEQVEIAPPFASAEQLVRALFAGCSWASVELKRRGMLYVGAGI